MYFGLQPVDFLQNLLPVKPRKQCSFDIILSRYCLGAKKLFTELNVPFKALEIDILPEGEQIQAELVAMTGQKTVPNIFINGRHIGGYDKICSMHEQKALTPLLQ